MHLAKSLFRFALVMVVLSAALLVLGAPAAPVAAHDCQPSYTVRPGDTLSGIAAWHHTTVAALASLNHLQRPNLIHVGQALCLPPQTPVVTNPATPSPSKLVIEAIYTYPLSPDEQGWTLVNRTVRRVEFPLAIAEDAIQAETSPAQLNNSVAEDTPARLWLSRPRESSLVYVLSVIGDKSVFESLGLQIPEAQRPVQDLDLLADQGLDKVESLTVWLEAGSGERFPLPIADVRYLETVDQAQEEYEHVYLVLLREGIDGAKVRLALGEDVFGPPGATVAGRCGRWIARRGLVYRFLWVWYGCRR